MGCGSSKEEPIGKGAPPKVQHHNSRPRDPAVQQNNSSSKQNNGDNQSIASDQSYAIAPTPGVTKSQAPVLASAQDSSAKKSRPTRPKHVLIGYHTSYESVADKVRDALSSRGFQVCMVSEKAPQDLDIREATVQWCDVFIMAASVTYERSLPCTELLCHVQGNKRGILSVVAQPNFRPRGISGAICSLGEQVGYEEMAGDFNAAIDRLKSCIDGCEEKGTDVKPNYENDRFIGTKITDGAGQKNGRIVVIHCSDLDARNILGAIRGATLSNPKTVDVDEIKNCHIVVPALTGGFQNCDICKEKFNIARATGRTIIPIIAAPHQRSGWLSLGIAGKLYYDWTGDNTSKSFYDSNIVQDFIYAVDAAKKETFTENQREEMRLNSFKKETETSKARLLAAGGSWPPTKRPKEKQSVMNFRQLYDDAVQKESKLRFAYIHHTITRMEFKAPDELFDRNGAPIKRTFDIMISYQWDIQVFVREFYMDMSMHELKTWFDIWGSMRGNTYSAMSYGIESSSVIISFVTERYQQSANCNLEIKYAIRLNKPIVFIIAEPGVKIRPWLQAAMDRNVVFHASNMADMAVQVGGMALVKRIAEAARLGIKHLVSKNPPPDDLTEEMFKLYEQKEDAEYQLMTDKSLNLQNAAAATAAVSSQPAGYTMCTRCDAKFVEGSASAAGCRRHRSYYMGGTIIAGRWTCCQQQGQDALGCEECNHTGIQENWQEMKGYSGCFQWVSAAPSKAQAATPANVVQSNTGTYAMCTRCDAKFIEGSADGCKVHRSYYMGGNIIAGRWTCCSQRGQDALGCQDAKHTSQQEKWTEMPGFSGCFKWER